MGGVMTTYKCVELLEAFTHLVKTGCSFITGVRFAFIYFRVTISSLISWLANTFIGVPRRYAATSVIART